MPISDEAIQKEKNNFIAVHRDATVGQAIAAWQASEGRPWWHLVAQLDDGSWGTITFADLHLELGDQPQAAEIRLGGWKGLATAPAVEQDSIDTKAAEAIARKSPGQVVVVISAGLPQGIIFEGGRRTGSSVPSGKLTELGGKYVNLKDYGLILLSSSVKKK